MKYLITCCLLWLTLGVGLAQSIRFAATPVGLAQDSIFREKVSSYSIFRPAESALDNQLRRGTTRIDLELGDQYNWTLELVANPIISPNYVLTIGTATGRQVQRTPPRIMTFRGSVQGLADSQVRLSVDGDFVYGYIRTPERTIYLEPANRLVPSAAAGALLVYDGADAIVPANNSCGTQPDNHQGRPAASTSRFSGDQFTVDYAVAVDYQIYQAEGSSITAVQNFVIGVTNNTDGDFKIANDLEDDYTFSIVEQYISTVLAEDPVDDPNANDNTLGRFRQWGVDGGFTTPRADIDVATLWTTRPLGAGNASGIAYTGVVCSSSNAYNACKQFQNAQVNRALLSHELGHNFSADHIWSSGNGRPATCPAGTTNFIMQPGIGAGSTNWSTTTGPCVSKPEPTTVQIANYTASSGGCLTQTALPVELTDFSGITVPEGILLSWVTASESGSAYFDLERSPDGKTFDPIARLDAANFTTEQSTYEFLDRRPSADVNYYRLRQVDLDGSEVRYPLVAVSIMEPLAPGVTPNPTTGLVNVRATGISTPRLLDNRGRVVQIAAERTASGFRLDLTGMPAGIYYLTVDAHTERIIVR